MQLFSWKRTVLETTFPPARPCQASLFPSYTSDDSLLPGPRFQSTYAKSLLITIYKIEAFKIYQRTQGEVLTLLKATAKCLKGFSEVQDLARHCWEEQNITFIQLQVDEKLAIKPCHTVYPTVLSPVFPFFCPRQSLVFMRESEGSL